MLLSWHILKSISELQLVFKNTYDDKTCWLYYVICYRQTISADVPLRVLLPAVTEAYSKLVSDNNISAVPHLMSLLGNSFKSGQQVNQDLTSFFLTALDFRSQSLSAADVCVIEPAVISATISLVLKLSESTFRPLYYKIFNWAFQSDVNKDRSITFYR